jgi:hypothetical protein
MPTRELNPNAIGRDEDWEGNNAAFRCPLCQKVFIVSDTRMHVMKMGTKATGSAQAAANLWGECRVAENQVARPASNGNNQIRTLPLAFAELRRA